MSVVLEPEAPLGHLTEAYVRVRYGDIGVADEDADVLSDTLLRVRPKGAPE
jgi:hypothetical protein